MNQIYCRMLNASAHGWLNWCQTCQPSIFHPSHHLGKSCGFFSTLSFLLTISFQHPLFPATPSGTAAHCAVYQTTLLQAYREPGMLNLVYLYQISTLTNCRRVCFHPPVFSGLNMLPHPPESPPALSSAPQTFVIMSLVY